MMEALGMPRPSDFEVDEIMREYGKPNVQEADFDRLFKMLQEMQRRIGEEGEHASRVAREQVNKYDRSNLDESSGRYSKIRDGSLDQAEVKLMLQDLGYAADDEYVAKMVSIFDTQGNGLLEVDELQRLIMFLNLNKDTAEAAMHVDAGLQESTLKGADANGDGGLGAAEVKHLMLDAGYKVEDAYVENLMKEFDTDASGKIDRGEVSNLIRFLGLNKSNEASSGPAATDETRSAASSSSAPSSKTAARIDVDTPYAGAAQMQSQRAERAVSKAAYTDRDRAVALQRFKLFDKNGDNSLNKEEVAELMTALEMNHGWGDEELSKLYADYGEGGEITDKKFLDMFTYLQEHKQRAEEDAMLQQLKTYDADGNGGLDAHEVKEFLVAAGLQVDDAYVAGLMKDFDTDGDGQIDISEIAAVLEFLQIDPRSTPASSSTQPQQVTDAMAVEEFEALDSNSDGTLDATEVRALMQAAGYAVDDSYVAELFGQFDADKSGRIDREEILQLLEFLQITGDKLEGAKKKLKGAQGFAIMDQDGDGTLDQVPRPYIPHVLQYRTACKIRMRRSTHLPVLLLARMLYRERTQTFTFWWREKEYAFPDQSLARWQNRPSLIATAS